MCTPHLRSPRDYTDDQLARELLTAFDELHPSPEAAQHILYNIVPLIAEASRRGLWGSRFEVVDLDAAVLEDTAVPDGCAEAPVEPVQGPGAWGRLSRVQTLLRQAKGLPLDEEGQG